MFNLGKIISAVIAFLMMMLPTAQKPVEQKCKPEFSGTFIQSWMTASWDEERWAEEAENMKRLAEAEEAARIQKELNEVKEKITAFFVENQSNLDTIKPVLEKVRELGYQNPTEIDSLDNAKIILEMTE